MAHTDSFFIILRTYFFMQSVFSFQSVETTASVPIPKNPLEQIIGQEEAVNVSKIAASQRRHLLLVGPPGVGKSMLAQAISYCLPKPSEEISVLHNPENPERPIVEVMTRQQKEKEKELFKQVQGKVVDCRHVPSFVAERLGFRCRRCGVLSKASQPACPNCGADKFQRDSSPFGDLLSNYLDEHKRHSRVHTTRQLPDGQEEVIVYERFGEQIRVLDQQTLEKMDQLKRRRPRHVIVPLNRKTFVVAAGASETELLGDVRHDPYGGHHQIGTQPYLRVVPGAIHEAHEGVLFVDELSALQGVQRFLLTAMQEKKYPIVGRNPQSSGASVRVDDVPSDFLLIAASNINDLPYILPPLRSRIIGNGYEVLLETTMPDTEKNREKFAQFVAQEIHKDGRIPHMSVDAVEELIDEARRRAKAFEEDKGNALSIRLRDISGIIRLAGDIAVSQKAQVIEKEFVETAIHRGRNIEDQLKDRYGSVWKAGMSEVSKESRGNVKEIS